MGQSVDGIRSRVNRHLTSARSDSIANRQIDVWEIAWVWAYPVKDKAEIGVLEDELCAQNVIQREIEPVRLDERRKSPEAGASETRGTSRSSASNPTATKYHRQLLGLAIEVEGDTGDD